MFELNMNCNLACGTVGRDLHALPFLGRPISIINCYLCALYRRTGRNGCLLIGRPLQYSTVYSGGEEYRMRLRDVIFNETIFRGKTRKRWNILFTREKAARPCQCVRCMQNLRGKLCPSPASFFSKCKEMLAQYAQVAVKFAHGVHNVTHPYHLSGYPPADRCGFYATIKIQRITCRVVPRTG